MHCRTFPGDEHARAARRRGRGGMSTGRCGHRNLNVCKHAISASAAYALLADIHGSPLCVDCSLRAQVVFYAYPLSANFLTAGDEHSSALLTTPRRAFATERRRDAHRVRGLISAPLFSSATHSGKRTCTLVPPALIQALHETSCPRGALEHDTPLWQACDRTDVQIWR